MNEIITYGAEIKQRILNEINSAQKSIYVAMAFFTDRDIANSIIQAKKRNLTVDIILSSNAQNETVKLMLKDAYITVHAFNTGDERGMMHHKFCLIDDKISINGSYNYSYNASNNNVENIHITDSLEIYGQLLTEFERLKYNIDHDLAIYESTLKSTQNTDKVKSINHIENFSQHLHNLVYLSTQINPEDYKNQGYERSKESQGHIDIFKIEYQNIRQQVLTYAFDESFNSKKNILLSNIKNVFDSKKEDLETDKLNDLSIIKNGHDIEKRQISEKTSTLKDEKSILESGNSNIGEKGLFQINKEIEKNKLEKRALEESFVIKRFFDIGTILVIGFLVVCFFYLSVFFASAIYKVFFEGNIILASLQNGLNPGLPQIIDANAIIKIFRQQGVLFGIISALVFLFPLSLTNLKILGSKNKIANTISFWIGLIVFDVLVSGMVAINTDKIEALLTGVKSDMQFWEVIKQGEFYLIFVFGMLPLFITHFLIEYVANAYSKSDKNLVDAAKSKKIQMIDEEMIELESQKEQLISKIEEKENLLKELTNKILILEKEINNQQNNIEEKYTELLKHLKSIFDDYSAKIISGKIFTDIILNSIITAYKTGFIEYLPEFYANNEVANRVNEIEIITNNN